MHAPPKNFRTVLIILLFALLTAPPAARATTLGQQDFTCALCGKPFSDKVLRSTNVMERDSELRPYAGGIQAIPFYVHACPQCGYADYSHDDKLTDPDKAAIQKFLAGYCKEHSCSRLNSAEKYEVTANCYILRKKRPLDIAIQFHRAAWMADDNKDADSARRFRKETIHYLVRALHERWVEANMVPTLTYMVGELHRHLGNFEDALKWYARVPDSAEAPVLALTAQGKKLAGDKNSGKAMMPAVPEKEKKG